MLYYLLQSRYPVAKIKPETSTFLDHYSIIEWLIMHEQEGRIKKNTTKNQKKSSKSAKD